MQSIAVVPWRRRVLRRRGLPIAAPALVLVALTVVLSTTVFERGNGTAWGAAQVRVAQASPRLLLRAEGWHVSRADQFDVGTGEMTFTNGRRELELRWQQADQYTWLIKDRAAGNEDLGRVAVAGSGARLFRYSGTDSFTAVWRRGEYTLEAVGVAPDERSFKETLASFEAVDVNTWLASMPKSVIQPTTRPDVVRSMLIGVPLPPGFDAAALERGDAVRDRYQLGAQVAGAVACAWIEQWISARNAGQSALARQAARAMATSHEWPVLKDMNAEGDYPEVVWEYADAMASAGTILAGSTQDIEDSYAAALGCRKP